MHYRSAAETGWLVLDVTIAVTAGGVRTATRLGVALTRTLRPLTDLAARPPLLPERYWPAHRLEALADSGRAQRRSAMLVALHLVRELVGAIVTAVDLPGIIRESTGSRTSEAVPGGRIQSAEADPAIAAWVDRVFRPHPAPPAEPGGGAPPEPG